MKRTSAIAISLLVSVAGCSATTSALGALTGSKPNQVTMVNNIQPQPVVVNVTVAQPAVAQPAENKHTTIRAAATGALAGAAVGTLVGFAMNGARGAETGAAVGAGTGAVTGVVVDQTR